MVTLGPGVSGTGPCGWRREWAPTTRRRPARGLFDAEGFRVQAVMIEPQDYRAYYDVIANQTLWFCLHGLWDLPRRPRFDRYWWSAWARFRAVNEQFAAAAAEAAAPGATVLVQDYQLALVPAMLAARRPDLRTAAFLHTPWCSPRSWRRCRTRWRPSCWPGSPAGAVRVSFGPMGRGLRGCCRERLGHARSRSCRRPPPMSTTCAGGGIGGVRGGAGPA